MIQFLGLLAPLVDKVLDNVLPDTKEREAAKEQMRSELVKNAADLQKIAADVVKQEAASSHWLAANWRPLTMLTFVGLIVARWLGWTAPGMTEAEYLSVYDLMKIGLGGYVAGRSVEKVLPGILSAIKK